MYVNDHLNRGVYEAVELLVHFRYPRRLKVNSLLMCVQTVVLKHNRKNMETSRYHVFKLKIIILKNGTGKFILKVTPHAEFFIPRPIKCLRIFYDIMFSEPLE